MPALAPEPIQFGVPPAVQELVWDVFFASRGRGISLQAHLPWLNASTGVHGLWLQDDRVDGGVGAALVIRERELSPGISIGLVGLVCVHELLRGQGLSGRLLRAATQLAQAHGLTELVLWTSKPDVYTRAGFLLNDRELFVRISSPHEAAAQRTKPLRQPFSCALPAFATAAWQSQGDAAQLTWLEGPAGVTLAAWHGAPEAVAALLATTLPAEWSVNLPENDSLLAALERGGFRCVTQPGAWRMRLPIAGSAPAPLPPIPLLERI